MKILVIDDSLLARKSLINSFKKLEPKAEFIEAENGKIGSEYFIKNKDEINLVFMDLTMPVMNGFEALKIIIKHDPNMKVVVVTADVQSKVREEVLANGAVILIEKPISEEKLQELLISGLI